MLKLFKNYKVFVLAFGLMTGVQLAKADSAITYSLDFGGAGIGSLPSNWVSLSGNFLANTPVVSLNGITGVGGSQTINFSITNVGVYDNGNADEPLTRDGFYTFGTGTPDMATTFTISGLNAGDQITIYAVSAWDGNGRGGTIDFGSSSTLAQVVGDPGTSPTLSNFTLINSSPVIADGTGIVTGLVLGPDGVNVDGNGQSDQQGQLGGLIVVVTPAAIPEPSTAALLLIGGLTLAGTACRKCLAGKKE